MTSAIVAVPATVGEHPVLPFANLPIQTQDCCVRPIALDDVDRRLLEVLQRDCSKTLFELGQEVRLSTSAVQRRIGRFERARLIERQAAVLNATALGEFVLALVLRGSSGMGRQTATGPIYGEPGNAGQNDRRTR